MGARAIYFSLLKNRLRRWFGMSLILEVLTPKIRQKQKYRKKNTCGCRNGTPRDRISSTPENMRMTTIATLATPARI
jgi:hypothetical protein